ncbi:MAG: universal stress protein [Gudongella sp.]|nr:universal stress protein [Gudongella sp.]
MKKILVPVDGSENSMKALEKAYELGTLKNSEILILTVVNSQRDNPYIVDQDYTSELSKENIALGEKLLEEAKKKFKDYPGQVKTLLRNGDVAETIIDIAEDEGFNVIVMGRRGTTISSRSLLGSVSNKVINYANTSVLVVK